MCQILHNKQGLTHISEGFTLHLSYTMSLLSRANHNIIYNLKVDATNLPPIPLPTHITLPSETLPGDSSMSPCHKLIGSLHPLLDFTLPPQWHTNHRFSHYLSLHPLLDFALPPQWHTNHKFSCHLSLLHPTLDLILAILATQVQWSVSNI